MNRFDDVMMNGMSRKERLKIRASKDYKNNPLGYIDGVDQAILSTLNALQRRWKKHYCFPTQDKLLELLLKHYGLKISKRTLNRHLRSLEDGKYFERTRRTKQLAHGIKAFTSTLYKLCHNAYRYIGSTVRKLSCHTRTTYKKSTQKTSPGRPSWMPGPEEKLFFETPGAPQKWDDLIKSMG